MKRTKIDWCDSSWSPISGCYHNCPYCYARGIATRFGGCDASPRGETDAEIVDLVEPLKRTSKAGNKVYAAYPYGFTPTLHEYKLAELDKSGYGKTLFVCSMADMFGEWVPDDWIEKIFTACRAHPEHRYLFLTKNPARYLELGKAKKLPEDDNFWYGSTVTRPWQPVFYSGAHHTFVSVEPIHERLYEDCMSPSMTVDWAIFGAETGNRAEKVVPERSWIEDTVNALREAGKPVFMKDSMIPIWGEDIPREFPWTD